jgi:predicted transcriptional regulator
MSKLEQIKDDVKRLSKTDQEALLDWLRNVLENELELTDEFKAEIERGEADIAAGRVRIVESDSARKERLGKFFASWDATHSVSVDEKPNRERTYSNDEPS